MIGTATGGDASATVTWTAPASNGGAAVTGYLISTYVGGTAEIATTVGNVTSDTVTGLTNGTAYTFTVSAINAVGEGLPSSNSNSVTPATVPGVPVIGTATGGDASATVTWTAPASNGVPDHELRHHYLCWWHIRDHRTVGNVTGDTVTGLTNGTAYTFTVSAINAVGEGLPSSNSNSVTPATVPGVPVIGTATGGDASATVTWTAPASNGGSAVTGYTVTAADSTTPANGGQACTWTTGPLTCSVTGLTNGDSYTFTVTATNGVGIGASSVASNSVTPATVPGVPVIGTATGGDASATVTWTAPASNGGAAVTGYLISTYVGGTAEIATTVGNVTSDTVTGLTNGTAYTFTVSAINAVGEGLPSSNSNSVTPATVPGVPVIGTATGGDASATVTWTAPASNGSPITNYAITTYVGGTSGTTVTVGNVTGDTVTGLTNGTAYTFTVSAINAVGEGLPSSNSNSVTPATVPGVPVIGTATGGDASATVTWTAPASNGGAAVTGYLISTYVGGTAEIATTVGNVTSDTVTGLTNGTAYTFTVSAINAVGEGLPSSNSNSVTPATVPGVPVIGTATGGDASATVTWTAPASNGGSAVTGYTVTAADSTTPANGGQACTWTTGPLTCSVTGLTNGDSYTFTVTATNGVGIGASSVASNSVTPATVPGVPVIGTATGGDASATVTWTAPASNGGAAVTGYLISTYVGGTAEIATTVGNVTSDTVTGLTNGTAYTFTVSAINAVGEGLPSSNSNSVTPATVPGVPVIGTATGGDASATVTWTAPASNGSPITNYAITTYVGGTSGTTVTVGNVTGDTVTGLTNGTAYTFTVSAINAVGEGLPSSNSNSVTPATVPGVPVIGTATGGDASATVTWTAPASNGGSAVTGYTVTAADSTTPANGGQACTWTTGPLTCSVTGLTNGDSYTFTVTATNGVGIGASSVASNSVTPATVPGVPVIGTATGGDASATVTWTAPASNGGSAVTGYTVTAADSTTPANGGQACTWTTGPLTCSVTGLTNGDSYTFTVTATNGVGIGASSVASNSVTPTGASVSSLTITNGSGIAGRADAGDQIIVTFATPPPPSAFCSLWSSSSYPDLTGINVAVTAEPILLGDDEIASVTDSSCPGGLHFGTIDLGQSGYFGLVVGFANSTVHWDGLNTLTITLGTPTIGDLTQNNPSVAVYTPDPALGVSGTISSPSEVNF